MAQGSYTTPTPGANGNGKASEAVDVGEQAQGTVPTAPLPYAKRIALRPLADSAVLSRRGRDDRERSVVRRSLPVPASTTGADQSQPPISLFGSDQSFARPKSNDIVVPFSALQLEEELARSLAEALYLKLSDIDVEIPFVDMGLDSVISVEWIQSLNKQYASNLTASSVYECSTIRQLAGFLEKTLLEQGRGIEQTPVPSLSSLSLDDVLQQVQQGSLDTGMAEKLLLQHFL